MSNMEMEKRELTLYNTRTQQKEVVKPINPGKIRMYLCGISAYGLSHLGHARAAVSFDVLYRYLKHLGYEVTYVRNFTDVDDKVINRAKECGENPLDLSSRFCDEYLVDMGALQCLLPTHQPRVSDHMEHIIKMIETIIAKDCGYEVCGDVFFSVDKSPNYGQLLDHTRAGERVAADPRKRNPADFALWKAAKPDEPSWESPWGPGRPGWHIECSAMSSLYLSPRFDIHGGGSDLKFPHHENEIAQTCAACDDSGVTYWLHNGILTKDNVKMGSSLGNVVTIRDIMAKYHPLVLRHFLISAHYRSPLSFSVLQLERSSDTLLSIYQTLQSLTEALSPHQEAISRDGTETDQTAKAKAIIKNVKSHFETQMSDDLNTAKLLSGSFQDAMGFISTSIIKLKTSQKKHLMSMVVSLSEVEKAVRDVLDMLGLLTPLTYADFLKELKQKALAREKLGEEEVSENKLDFESNDGRVVCHLASDKDKKTSIEVMDFATPAGNIVRYVRKTFGSSELAAAQKEFRVMKSLRGAIGVIQCKGDSIHERKTYLGEKVYVIFMEYARGGTLGAMIKLHPKGLPPATVSKWTRMILVALKSIHEAGFIHGDLHAQNVLLFPREGELEEVRISDFGASVELGENVSWWSLDSRFLACPDIMSPESVLKGMLVEAHDIWAVGCVVLQMFTNKPPWPNSYRTSKIESCFLLNVAPTVPPTLPDTARDFVRLCLKLDPEERATIPQLLDHPFLSDQEA